MITLVLTEVARLTALALRGHAGREGHRVHPAARRGRRLRGDDHPRLRHHRDVKLAFYYLAVILMILCFAGLYRLVHSRLGHLCRSLQQNEELASSIGVNIAWLRIVAYAISSFLGGIGGAVFVAISQSIYPSSFQVKDSIDFMLNCFLGGLGYVFGPMLGTLLLYFGWDLLFETGKFQLLIYSSLLIALILMLPNGLLSLRLPGRGRPCGERAARSQGGDQAVRRPDGGQRRVVLGAGAERHPVGHRPERRGEVHPVQADLLLRAHHRRRGPVPGRAHLEPGAARRGPQGSGADLPGDHDLQGHDGARQRRRRPSSTLRDEPARLLPRSRGGARGRGGIRPIRGRDPDLPGPRPTSGTRSRATCRRATCGRWGSPSVSPPIRPSCSSTSRSRA